jgi:hypothetical protein
LIFIDIFTVLVYTDHRLPCRERELLTIRLIDYFEKATAEEAIFLPAKCQQVINTMRGHVEDSLTSLTGDILNAFSKSKASSTMEYSHKSEDKYDDIVGEGFYDGALDAYNREVVQGFASPLWETPKPLPLSRKRKATSAAASPSPRPPLGFARPQGKGKGGKGKGDRRGKGGKGLRGKGKGRGQRGRGRGAWKSRT